MQLRLTEDRAFVFWRRYLLVMTAVFALQGVSWMAFGSFDPFGIYSRLMARALLDAPVLTPEADAVFSFAVVPLGATTAGFFVLVHFLVRFGFARRERWSYDAVVAGVLVWFALDSTISVHHGAWFNVGLVNVPCLVVLGVPLWFLRRHFVADVGPGVPADRARSFPRGGGSAGTPATTTRRP